VLWPFIAVTARMVVAACASWIAVKFFGAGMGTLAMIAASLVIYATVIAAMMRYAPIWQSKKLRQGEHRRTRWQPRHSRRFRKHLLRADTLSLQELARFAITQART